MKQIFKNFLEKAIADKQALLSVNSISEEDKAVVESAIASLQETLQAVEAAEDDTAVEALKETVAAMQEQLTAVKEKISQTQKTEPEETTMENYLSTNTAVKDFISAVKSAKNGAEFQKNWNQFLSTNGISITAGSEYAFLPDVVRGRIQDIWDRNADWLKDLNLIGAKRYTIRHNSSDQDAANSRAKGFKKGDTKTSQELAFAAKLVTPQFIYKLQEISLEDEFNDDGSLLDYIVKELVDQILYEEKRAILVGDGRVAGSTGKIDSFEAIVKSTSDAYTTVSTVTANGFLVDDIRAMVDNIKNDNNKPIYVFMSKTDLRTLSRVQASETSTPMYMSNEQVAEQIGASKIITTDLLGEAAKAVAMIPSEYVMIGENVLNPTLFSWHEGYKNMDVYRYECVAGGAIEGLKSTAVLKAE